jgi:hypothetical protein
MEIFKIRNVYVIGKETNYTYELPVRSESFSARVGRDLEVMNLSGCYVYKTYAAAKRALKALAG